MSAPSSWPRAAGALALAAALVAAPATGAGAAPRDVPDAGHARAAAERAASDVDSIVADLALRLEEHEAAQRAMAGSVQRSVVAETGAHDAAALAAGARARHSRTVRALYTSGGAVAVLSSLLDAGSLADLADRSRVAETLLQGASQESHHATATHAEALRSAGDDARAADAQVAAAAELGRAADAVEASLADARSVLAGLSAAADTAEAEAAAAAAAAAEEARRAVAEAERLVAVSRGAGGPSHSVPGSEIPAAFQALYVQAAQTCPGMRWTQLAAVGQVETRHGRNNGPSSAGAEGPMQFMPGTFARYGVDGDGDGVADPWNPADAIHSAAHYLCVNGAGAGTPEAERRSLLRYNNAGWYVDLVQGTELRLVSAQG